MIHDMFGHHAVHAVVAVAVKNDSALEIGLDASTAADGIHFPEGINEMRMRMSNSDNLGKRLMIVQYLNSPIRTYLIDTGLIIFWNEISHIWRRLHRM